MPYIKQERRDAFKDIRSNPKTAGELNYMVTEALLAVKKDSKLARAVTKLALLAAVSGYTLETLGKDGKVNYEYINTVVGALMSAGFEFARRTNADPYDWRLVTLAKFTAEFYRRLAFKYEDKKIAENGDIPGYQKWNEAKATTLEATQSKEGWWNGQPSATPGVL